MGKKIWDGYMELATGAALSLLAVGTVSLILSNDPKINDIVRDKVMQEAVVPVAYLLNKARKVVGLS